MKISCDIIRDILPLYAEDMVSDATKEMVDAHLCNCESCTNELNALKKTEKLPVEADITSLKRVGDSIRRRRILAVMAVFLFVATVLIGGALMLDATIYLSATEAVEDIWVDGNTVKIRWADGITGTSSAVDQENPINYEVVAWTRLGNILFPPEYIPYEALSDEVKALITEDQYAMFDSASTYSLVDGTNGTNFWYRDPGNSSMTLILNADQPFPEAPLMEVDHYTAYYVGGLAFACIVCLFLGMLNKNRWYGELAGRLGVLFGSMALSVVIVTAGQLAGFSGDFQEALVDSSVVAVPMCLVGLCVRQLIKLNRQDKGL